MTPDNDLDNKQAIYASQEVTQVNVSTASGDMGVLSAHVPSVESLRPGLVEVIEQSGSKKYFGQYPHTQAQTQAQAHTRADRRECWSEEERRGGRGIAWVDAEMEEQQGRRRSQGLKQEEGIERHA